MNKPCNTCVNRGWTTFAEVAACNCCEAPDYEFFMSDSEQSEIEVQNEHTPDESIRRIWTLRGEREKPEPLTMEQLREMHGEPVWVKDAEDDEFTGWYLVDMDARELIGLFTALDIDDVENCGLDAYAHKPNGEARP